jgi:hypothetical protein
VPLLCNCFVKLYIFLKITIAVLNLLLHGVQRVNLTFYILNEKALRGSEGHVLQLMSVCNSLTLRIDKVALGGLLAVRHIADFRELEVYKCKFQFI